MTKEIDNIGRTINNFKGIDADKLFASEPVADFAVKTVQIHGGYGYTKDYIDDCFFRDAKITEINELISKVKGSVDSRRLLRY